MEGGGNEERGGELDGSSKYAEQVESDSGASKSRFGEEEEEEEDDADDREYDVLQRLGMTLHNSEFAIPITHGDPIMWERCKLQGQAAPIQSIEDMEHVIESLRYSHPWSAARCQPCAFRIAGKNADGADSPIEGHSDGGDTGVGEKLLHLLRRWDVKNVVLAVTCWDTGIKGRLGAARFRVYLDCAKSVLEQCYMESLRGPSQGGSVASSDAEGSIGTMGDSQQSSIASYSNTASRASMRSSTRDNIISAPTSAHERWGKDDAGNRVWGMDFAKVYTDTRKRLQFLKNRATLEDVSKCVLDGDSVGIPHGDPDGLGGFDIGQKRGRVNHFLASADGNLDARKERGNSDSSQWYGMGADELRVALPEITRGQLDEAKRTVRPHPQIFSVFRCVAIVLGYEDLSWEGCREMLSGENFLREIVLLDVGSIPMKDIDNAREILSDPAFTPENIRRQSVFAAEMLQWCIRVVQTFDYATLGVPPTRSASAAASDKVQVINGQTKVALQQRMLTLGSRIERSRTLGKTKWKAPKVAPIHRRNDVGPQPLKEKVRG
eukprot:g1766.t1